MDRYQGLPRELKRLWKVETKVIPIVVGALSPILTICNNDILKQLKFSYGTEDEFNRLVHSNNVE